MQKLNPQLTIIDRNRTYAVDPFSRSLWFVVAQFIALSSGISPQFWHGSQFCVSPVEFTLKR